MFKPVSNNPSLARDVSSNAIINMDLDGYKSYINSRNKMNHNSEKIHGLEEQVTILSDELSKIKCLLDKIIK